MKTFNKYFANHDKLTPEQYELCYGFDVPEVVDGVYTDSPIKFVHTYGRQPYYILELANGTLELNLDRSTYTSGHRDFYQLALIMWFTFVADEMGVSDEKQELDYHLECARFIASIGADASINELLVLDADEDQLQLLRTSKDYRRAETLMFIFNTVILEMS